MKTHILKNKSVYPTVHAWVSSDKPKINVYSSKVIMPGDKIEFEGMSFTVDKAKPQQPTKIRTKHIVLRIRFEVMKLDDEKSEFIALAISGLIIIAVLIMITYAAVYFQGVNQREKYIIENHSELK